EWILFADESTRYKGGQWIELPVRLETLPLFVKAGSIIPMMPVMQYIHDRENHPIIIKVFPKVNSTARFELYEDDGVTKDDKQDGGSRTYLECSMAADGLTFRVSPVESKGYTPPKRNYIVERPVNTRPKSVMINGVRVKIAKAEKVNAAVDTD